MRRLVWRCFFGAFVYSIENFKGFRILPTGSFVNLSSDFVSVILSEPLLWLHLGLLIIVDVLGVVEDVRVERADKEQRVDVFVEQELLAKTHRSVT